jgi:hypothetical protein
LVATDLDEFGRIWANSVAVTVRSTALIPAASGLPASGMMFAD